MRNRTEAKARAKELVSRMTPEEKASQLRYDAPAIERLGIPAYNWWNEALHGVARAGTATVFPQAIALAAMFDEDMQENISNLSKLYPLVVGLMELRVKGISDYYNTIKKVSLKSLQKQLKKYSEITVKVVEKRFVDKRTKEENFYNSYVIKSGELE